MQRTERLKRIRYSSVFDENGNRIGLAKDILSKRLIEIRLSQEIFSNDEAKDIFWVECPICGLRGKHLHEHGCGTGELVAPLKYVGVCPECSRTFVISREDRFRGIGCKCGICSMKENQIKHNLEKFGVKYVFQNKEINQKSKATRKRNLKEQYGVEHIMQVKEFAERNKESRRRKSMERYGVPSILCTDKVKKIAKQGRERFLENANVSSISQLPGVKEKIKQTNIDKYGVAFPLMSEEIREKAKHTLFLNYGVTVTFKSKEIQDKIRNTLLEYYGVDHPWKSGEIREQIVKTWIERYGVDNPFKAKEIREKIVKTWIERYGVDNPMRNPEIVERVANTLQKHYGVRHTMESPEIVEKLKSIFRTKYGVDFPLQSDEIHDKTKRSAKHPRTEKKIAEMLTNRGLDFIQQVRLGNRVFDFMIVDKELNPLLLIDVDGIYYHGYLSDLPDKVYRYDEERITYCDKIPFVVIFENELSEGIERVFRALDFNYSGFISDLFGWCIEFRPFPYPNYSETILKNSWNKLCEYEHFNRTGDFGQKLIKQFHPSIYSCSRNGKLSPIEGFNNDAILMECIRNRFIYQNVLDPSTIANGLNLSGLAPTISLFMPGKAKQLILKYLNQYNQIFDPFSGYSGRMLGTIASGKEYIGQDCNETTITESEDLAKFLDIHPILSVQDSTKTTGKYECLFTCPPYNLKENWGQEIENHSCNEWIDICLRNYDCQTYLFVVDKTEKYKDFVVETINNNSHLAKSSEQVVLIHKTDL